VYRNIRYTLDRGHPLQVPCGARGLSLGLWLVFVLASESLSSSWRPWECGNPEGISKECGKDGKPALWLSMLSILCHFHGLLLRADKVEVAGNPGLREIRFMFSCSRGLSFTLGFSLTA
jgi:hypothetical protein